MGTLARLFRGGRQQGKHERELGESQIRERLYGEALKRERSRPAPQRDPARAAPREEATR